MLSIYKTSVFVDNISICYSKKMDKSFFHLSTYYKNVRWKCVYAITTIKPIYIAAPHITKAEPLLRIRSSRPDGSSFPVSFPINAKRMNHTHETMIHAAVNAIFSEPV